MDRTLLRIRGDHAARRDTSRRGTSLVVTTVLVFSLAGISLSLASLSRSSAEENRTTKDETNAYYIAQAGLAQAVQDLRAGGTGALGSLQQQQEFGGARFWVDSVDLGNGLRSLVATGVDNRAGARIELVLQEAALPFFRYGAFGELGLTLDSNATIDSYNSNLGPYSLNLNKAFNGNAGSNRNISLRSNSRIHGSAQPGPGHAVTILGNAVVSGATSPAPAPFELPPIEFPAAPGPNNYTLNGTATLVAGLHQLANVRLNSNSVLTINGPATIVCSNLELRSNSQIIVNATNGPVEFYVDGDFKMLSNAKLYASDLKPANVKVFLNGDNIIDPDTDVQVDPQDDEFQFNSNTQIYGVVYAPNAFVEIESNFECFGAMIARRLHLDSNSKIHFDESLLTETEDSESELQAVLWRRRPFSMSELGQ